MGLTDKLPAPRNPENITEEWARRILVAHKSREDPDWLLAAVLKVLEVKATANPTPGMLSNSYMVEVSYREGDDMLRIEPWFVKVPKNLSTSSLDNVEFYMYNILFKKLETFSEIRQRIKNALPIPKVYHCSFSDDPKKQELNMVVSEDLRGRGFQPLQPEICGVRFMRAQMRALASIHATGLAYQEDLGGKRAFLRKNPLVQERTLPKMKLIKPLISDRLLPYLKYLEQVRPELKHQLSIFTKFERHLFRIFKKVHATPGLAEFKGMIHGDSKMDNFMFKKIRSNSDNQEDEYEAVLIDWQGVCYDLLSSDVMWALYGFMKNLPDKNSTIDSFLDYSLAFYYQELLKGLKRFKIKPDDLGLPADEYDGVALIKKGFVHEFLRVVLIKPCLGLLDPDILKSWYSASGSTPAPDTARLFKGGEATIGFIFLYFTIATEVGVFHELAPMCFSVLKEAMFGGGEDSDDEDAEEDNLFGLSKKDLASKGLLPKPNEGVPNCDKSQESVGPLDSRSPDKKAKDEKNEALEPVMGSSNPPPDLKNDKKAESSNGTKRIGNGDKNPSEENDVNDPEDSPSSKQDPSRCFLRRESSLSLPLPDVLENSDDDDYEYNEDNKDVVSGTVYVRTALMDGSCTA